MKLRTRLTTAFLCCGLIPLALASLVGYFTSSGSMQAIEQHATEDLEKKSKDQLVAFRDIKKSQIEGYFATIRDQMLTFSENRMIVDAMREFREPFGKFREENGIDANTLQDMRSKLETYYSYEFTEEYKKQNGGAGPNARQHFDQLDDDSLALQFAYIRANKYPLGSKHKLDTPGDRSGYSQLHTKYHPVFVTTWRSLVTTTSSC